MFKKKEDLSNLSPEEFSQKKKSRVRLLALVIFLDIFMVVYLVYEIITLFSK